MFRFEEFPESLRLRNYRPTTISKYVYTLSLLGRFLQVRGVADDRLVTKEHLTAFLKDHMPADGSVRIPAVRPDC